MSPLISPFDLENGCTSHGSLVLTVKLLSVTSQDQFFRFYTFPTIFVFYNQEWGNRKSFLCNELITSCNYVFTEKGITGS